MNDEMQLGQRVVAWLDEYGWKVYQEVTFRGGVADIVATRGPLVQVIECKCAFGLAVLDQAYRWRPFANYISVAVEPAARRGFGREVASRFGIGVLQVGYDRVLEESAPEFYRRIAPGLRNALRDEHRTFAPAGTANGYRFTPYQATCRELESYVRANPGCTLRSGIDAIRHHYATPASARGALRKWIEQRKVRGVRLKKVGRDVILMPAPAK